MSSKNFLIIDTSNYKPFVALVVNDNVVSKSFLNKNSLGLSLENSIENFLQIASHLDFISVCSGPGNFSSTRTGVAFALGLQASLDIPIVSWDSTTPFISDTHNVFVNIIDGGKKGCFVVLKEKVNGELVVKSQLQFMLFDQLTEFLKANECFYLVGPYLSNVEQFFLERELKCFFEEKDPDFLFLKDFCFALFQNKQYSDNVRVTYLKEIN